MAVALQTPLQKWLPKTAGPTDYYSPLPGSIVSNGTEEMAQRCWRHISKKRKSETAPPRHGGE